jgi:hypothetical protein
MLIQFIKAFWLPAALIAFSKPISEFLSHPINVMAVGLCLAGIIAVYVYRRGQASLSQTERMSRNDGIDHGARRAGIYFLFLIPTVGLLYLASPGIYEGSGDLPPYQSSQNTYSAPDQWQYEESQIVPLGPVPTNRCVRAVYLSENLKRLRNAKTGEWWSAPVHIDIAEWLQKQRDLGNLTLTFCDKGGDA